MDTSRINIEKFENGKLKTVTFDARKYSKILTPILEDLGLLEDSRLQKKFYSLKEAKAETKKSLTDLCKKENLL